MAKEEPGHVFSSQNVNSELFNQNGVTLSDSAYFELSIVSRSQNQDTLGCACIFTGTGRIDLLKNYKMGTGKTGPHFLIVVPPIKQFEHD